MYLIVDRGNSFTKIALFGEGELIDLKVISSAVADEMNSLLNGYATEFKPGVIDHGIFSSVVKDNNEIVASLRSRMNLMVMSEDTPLPVMNRYESPETLGNDRIAAAVGATFLHPGSNVLTIDAGTCITFDMTTSDRAYLGGGISPGIHMRFKALHTFTSKLPLVSLEGDAGLIGSNTLNSIRSGVLNGVIAEVDGIIDRYRERFPDLQVLLTGGDANYFDKKLKNNIFAVPNLVLLGLKDILQYNVEI